MHNNYIVPLCSQHKGPEEPLSALCVFPKCRKYFQASCVDCNQVSPHPHVGFQYNLHQSLINLHKETHHGKKRIRNDEFENHEYKRFMEIADMIDNLVVRYQEIAKQIRNQAEDLAYFNISTKYEVKQILKSIFHDQTEQNLQENLQKMKQFVEINEKNELKVPEKDIPVNFDKHKSIINHLDHLRKFILETLNVDLTEFSLKIDDFQRLPIDKEDMLKTVQREVNQGVARIYNNLPIKWVFEKSTLYNSQQVKIDDFGVIIQAQTGTNKGHQLLFSSQGFGEGVHTLQLKIESVFDKHKTGCVGIGILKTQFINKQVPQNEFGCYKCLFCKRWSDQVEIFGNRQHIGDQRDLIERGDTIQIELDLDKHTFKIFSPSKKTWYQANPKYFQIKGNVWHFCLWFYNSEARLKVLSNN